MSASAISVVAVVGANGGQLPTFQLVLGYLLHALEHASTVISEGTLLCLSRRSSPPWASPRTLFSGPTTRFYVRRRRQLAVYPADRKTTTEKYLWSLHSIFHRDTGPTSGNYHYIQISYFGQHLLFASKRRRLVRKRNYQFGFVLHRPVSCPGPCKNSVAWLKPCNN